MSNRYLNSALKELQQAQAKKVPGYHDINSAEDNSEWEGQKENGDPWKLIKHSEESYEVIC